MESSVFYGCGSLAQITNYAATPLEINSNIFDGNADYPAVDKSTCKLYVPEESLDLYKAADVWKDFSNILPIGSEEGIENTNANAKANKVIKNGQLLIERNGKTFNAVGTEVK